MDFINVSALANDDNPNDIVIRTGVARRMALENYEKIVRYEEFNDAIGKINFLQTCAIKKKALGGFMTGLAGVGKTTVAQVYTEMYLAEETPRENYQPIISIELTKRTNVNSVLKSLLRAMNSEYADRASETDLIHKCEIMTQQLETELIIVDEAHNLLSGLSSSDPEGVFDTFKNLMNRCQCSIVLVGLPHLLEVFDHLPEEKRDIKRRFKVRIKLESFSLGSWDTFKDFVRGVLEKLDCNTDSLETDAHFMKAMLYTTDGVQNEVIDIINAGLDARSTPDCLTLADIKLGMSMFEMDRNGFVLDPDKLSQAMNEFYGLTE